MPEGTVAQRAMIEFYVPASVIDLLQAKITVIRLCLAPSYKWGTMRFLVLTTVFIRPVHPSQPWLDPV